MSKNAILRQFPPWIASWCDPWEKSWLKWQVFPSWANPALILTAPSLTLRLNWQGQDHVKAAGNAASKDIFLSVQFSSTCSNQCFWESTGKTEDGKLGVFHSWRWSIKPVNSVPAPAQYPHTHNFLNYHVSRRCSQTTPLSILLHRLLTQFFFSFLFSHMALDRRDTLTSHSSLFPAALNCMVPLVEGSVCSRFLTQSFQPENSLPDAPSTPFRPQNHPTELINAFRFIELILYFGLLNRLAL